MRPRISALPSVGRVIRARIFSSVLLPAPLRPISPTTSPSFTSKLTSFNAQMKGDSHVGRARNYERNCGPG